MVAMTPIMHFLVNEEKLELWTEDYSGIRTLVATSPTREGFEWLVNCTVSFHKCKVERMESEDDV